MDFMTTSMISKFTCPLSAFPPFPPEVLLLAMKMADPSISFCSCVCTTYLGIQQLPRAAGSDCQATMEKSYSERQENWWLLTSVL